jgi:hypothetical protein
MRFPRIHLPHLHLPHHLPKLTKTQKKVAIGAGAGVALLTALFFATRSKSSGSGSSQTLSIRAPKGTSLPAGVQPPQFLDQQLAGWKQSIANAAAKGLNETNTSFVKMFKAHLAEVEAHIAYLNTAEGVKKSLDALNWLLSTNYAAMTNGNVVLLNADAFRKIYTHGGTKALDLISGVFYPHGMCNQFGGPCNLFSTDEISNHAHCQTFANQVVQLGQAWVAPFYNTVYRYPSSNPNYAGNAIDPHADPGEWENQRQQAVEAAVKKAEHAADFGDAMDNFNEVLYVTGAVPVGTLYTMVVSDLQKTRLAQLAIDMMAKNNVAAPTTDAQGNAIPEPQLTMIHASIGAGIVAHLIDVFESSSPDINPCVRKLDAGLVFQMFAATLGVVIGLAIGPALSGIGIALQIATTIQKLAQLSK